MGSGENKLTSINAVLISLVTAALATPVWAQSEQATSAGDAQSGLEEVIVTAQKRTENIQDVGMSITAIQR